MNQRFVFILFLLTLSGCGADVDTTLDSGQAVVQPVVLALEKFRDANQTYPNSLDLLVDNGLMDILPELPTVSGTYDKKPLRYSVAPDGSFYCLSFAYDFPDGIGPASLFSRYYTSFDNKWQTSKYPPSFSTLVADRMGIRYQDDGSFVALDSVVKNLLKAADMGAGSVNVFESNVTKRLGKGVSTEVPTDLAKESDVKTIRYDSSDPDQASYVFVFTNKTTMARNKDGTFSDREFVVARAVYEVTGATKTRKWSLVAECR